MDRRLAGAALLLALALVASAVQASAAAASASGTAIYYDSPGQGIALMNLDGSQQRQFVAGGSEPSWSADGTKMVYLVASSTPHCQSSGSSGGPIKMVDGNGANPVTLGGACGGARISPDGTHVTYASSPDQVSVLSVAAPQSTVRLVTVPDIQQCAVALGSNRRTACEFGTEPSWAASSTVVYSDDTSQGGGLWSLPSAGGTNVPASFADDNSGGGIDYGISGLAINPANSSQAVVSSQLGTANANLYLIPAGGATGTEIASAPAGHSYVFPQWSPDGSTIAFEDDGPGNTTTIHTVPAAGGAVSAPLATGRNPAFGPAQNTHRLTVRTVDESLNPIPDQNVTLTSGGQSTTISTGPTGTATLDEPIGAYTVVSSPADGTFKPLRSGDCTIQGQACAVNLDQDRSVAFQAQRDRLEFHFTPSSVAADGLGFYSGEVDDLDPAGSPVSGVSLAFTPPVESPKALVCSATGRLYPQLLGSAIAFHPFRSITQEGKVEFTVHPGTEPGPWLLDATELNKRVPATGSIDPPFTPAPRRLPADVPQRLYDLLRALPTGQRAEILHLSGQPVADQAVLLAFLGTQLRSMPDFGPIHTGGDAAVEFYDATGATAVLDTKLAGVIAEAALARQPLPADAIHLPTLPQYEAVAGVTTRGTLMPQPDGELTYFGFPYPPLTQNGEADAAFYDQCLRPDALYFHVEVHSPVRLLFTDRRGRRFGLDAAGRAVRGGAGLMLTDKAHHTTTFVLPAGRYKVVFKGSGNGRATIVAFTPGHTGERGQTVLFPVRKGKAGTASLTAGGLGRAVKFAGHRYRVSTGVGLRLKLAPAHLRHGSRPRVVKVRVSDQFGRQLAGALIAVRRGRSTVATGLTNARGIASVRVSSARKGKLVVRVSAAAARPRSVTLPIT